MASAASRLDLRPACLETGCSPCWPGRLRLPGLRHSFVAILVAAGCNVREVSEWAGHNSVAFTLTRYGGLFEDGSNEAVDRLGALLADRMDPTTSAICGASRCDSVSPVCPPASTPDPGNWYPGTLCLVRGGIPNGIRTRAAALKGRLGQ